MLIHNETLELSGDRDMVIHLQAGMLEGRVADAVTKEPIGLAAVQLFPTEGVEFTVAGSCDESGRFRLPRVPPGRFRLRVSADGYSPGDKIVEIPAGPAGPPVEVALEPAPGLELRVRLASGVVPNHVQLRAETPTGVLAMLEQRRVEKGGVVRISTLAAGTWHLAVGASGSSLARLTATVPGPPVAVILPDAARLHIHVPALAESNLVGTVGLYAPGGAPLEILTLGGQVETRTTVADGRATIAAVPAGTWSVQVETPDGRRWGTVAITDGQRESIVQVE
jgi:hypothetical protein